VRNAHLGFRQFMEENILLGFLSFPYRTRNWSVKTRSWSDTKKRVIAENHGTGTEFHDRVYPNESCVLLFCKSNGKLWEKNNFCKVQVCLLHDYEFCSFRVLTLNLLFFLAFFFFFFFFF